MTTVTVDGRTIEVSNDHKVFFPDDGITKGDLVEYYRRIADRMIPNVRERPFVMHRFPDGITGEDFFHKDTPRYFPDWIARAELPKRGGTVTHVLCNDAATLVYLANQGMITPHCWSSRADRPGHPDQMLFDLDPGDDVSAVPRVARSVRDLLDHLGLPSYAKSTGSRGIHVHVPLERKADFEEVAAFAMDVARVLEHESPDELSTTFRKADRGGRLFLDTLRNAYAQHAVAVYGVRPRPGAPVAAPLDWDEATSRSFDAQRVTIANVFRRLSQKRDPWEGMADGARGLSEPRKRLDKMLGGA